MKRSFIISIITLSSMLNAQYCLPTFQYNADGNMITNVSFVNINNSSPFQSGTTPVYEDFTSVLANAKAGENYIISVKGPSSTFPSDVMLFIDFNKNGSFEDEGESFYIGRLGAANPANALTVINDISIPQNAVSGTTRMRVLKNTNVEAYSNPDAPNSIASACDANLRSGQAEDYSINIQPANLSTQEIEKIKQEITIYPNPVRDIIYFEDLNNIETIEIYSISGKRVLNGNSNRIDVSELNPGHYFVKVKTKDQNMITKKIIKE